MLEATSPTATKMDPTEKLTNALEKLTTVSRTTSFKVPAYSGDSDVELFVKCFRNVASDNNWSEQDAPCTSRDALRARLGPTMMGICRRDLCCTNHKIWGISRTGKGTPLEAEEKFARIYIGLSFGSP